MTRCFLVCGATVLATLLATGDEPQKAAPGEFMGLPLVFADDFESGKSDKWQPGDKEAWKVVKQDGKTFFSQHQQSKVMPPVRSPVNWALIKDLLVGDFVFEARVQSTGKENPHRDLCFFFGCQGEAGLYYVHLSPKADEHANSIFLVDGKPRVSIAQKRTDGTRWTDGWHTVRIVRKVEPGSIEVFFDNLKEPVMTAQSKRFAWGQVGIGSFDDTGNFDDVRLWGRKVEPSK